MTKVYFSKDKAKIVFSFQIGNEVKTVMFTKFGGTYSTSDKEIQKAIENSFYFKTGKVFLNTNTSDSESDTDDSDEIKEFPDVIIINDAVAILTGEYKVAKSKLKSKEAVFTVAKELGVSFPNLSPD